MCLCRLHLESQWRVRQFVNAHMIRKSLMTRESSTFCVKAFSKTISSTGMNSIYIYFDEEQMVGPFCVFTFRLSHLMIKILLRIKNLWRENIEQPLAMYSYAVAAAAWALAIYCQSSNYGLVTAIPFASGYIMTALTVKLNEMFYLHERLERVCWE